MILIVIALLYETVQFLLGERSIVVKTEILLESEVEHFGIEYSVQQSVLIIEILATNSPVPAVIQRNRHLRPAGLQTDYITYYELSHIPS
jgi:hypothetical protein